MSGSHLVASGQPKTGACQKALRDLPPRSGEAAQSIRRISRRLARGQDARRFAGSLPVRKQRLLLPNNFSKNGRIQVSGGCRIRSVQLPCAEIPQLSGQSAKGRHGKEKTKPRATGGSRGKPFQISNFSRPIAYAQCLGALPRWLLPPERPSLS